MPDPAIQFFQRFLGFGQLEISHPATKNRVEFGDDIDQTTPSRAFEHIADFVFQALEAGRCYPQFRGFVPRHAVAQKLPLSRMRYRALGRIDRELERVRQKLGDARHDPLSRHFAFDVDIAVIRISAEGVTTTFQFPIQLCQQDV